MEKKKILVIIPHFNNPDDLIKSIKSIDDTKVIVDIIIIDDGSDNLPNETRIRANYTNGDIFFKYLSTNKGLSFALNLGVDFAQKKKYTYTGRLDSGDTCIKNRFFKQIRFLESNKEVKLLGTWAQLVDERGKDLFVLKHPCDYKSIKKQMYLNNMFVHPSVVFRTEVFDAVGCYNEKYSKAAQDYDLFFKIMKKFKVANLGEPLLNYEINSNSISSKRRKLQVKHRIQILLENFYIGFYPMYGLFRNVVLYFISRNTSNLLKSLVKKSSI